MIVKDKFNLIINIVKITNKLIKKINIKLRVIKFLILIKAKKISIKIIINGMANYHPVIGNLYFLKLVLDDSIVFTKKDQSC